MLLVFLPLFSPPNTADAACSASALLEDVRCASRIDGAAGGGCSLYRFNAWAATAVNNVPLSGLLAAAYAQAIRERLSPAGGMSGMPRRKHSCWHLNMSRELRDGYEMGPYRWPDGCAAQQVVPSLATCAPSQLCAAQGWPTDDELATGGVGRHCSAPRRAALVFLHPTLLSHVVPANRTT
eukprot:352467-Chlamydomonas_euryale.AAC.1